MSDQYKKLAVEFAEALASNNFGLAKELLSSECNDDLVYELDEMISYGSSPVTEVELMNSMEDWPSKQATDIGWAYVALCGEGLTSHLSRTPQAAPLSSKR